MRAKGDNTDPIPGQVSATWQVINTQEPFVVNLNGEVSLQGLTSVPRSDKIPFVPYVRTNKIWRVGGQ